MRSISPGKPGKGFFYGWVIVAASTVSVFAGTATAPPLFSVFITPMVSEFGWSRTLISGAHSFGTLLAAFISPLVGRLVDRYGSRWVIATGAVILGSALSSLSQIGNVVGFYLGFGISRAIGQSVMDQASTLAVANWFVRRRPRALSFLNMGRGIGGTLMPILAYAAISSAGWRGGWVAIGFMVIAAGVLPAAIFLRRRPEDIGLTPDGIPAASADPKTLDGTSATHGHDTSEPSFTLRDATKTSAFWILAMAMFVRGMCTPGIVVHMMPYLLSLNIEPSQAAMVVSVFAASLAVGGLFWGSVAQLIQVRYCLVSAFLGATVAVAMLLGLDTATEGFIYAVVFGSSIGGVFTLEGVIWANYFGRASLGAIYGSAMMILLLGITLGPLLAGLSFDLLGSYQAAFLLFDFGYALCATLVFLSRAPRRVLPDPGVAA